MGAASSKFLTLIPMVIILCCVTSCRSVQEKQTHEYLKLLKQHSLYRYTTDWNNLSKKILTREKKVQSKDKETETLYYALDLMGDTHSFVLSPEKAEEVFNPKAKLPVIETRLIENRIGYIKIPAFWGNDSLTNRFVKNVQEIISELDEKNVSEWIIDLRENYGGNMWPMMLAVSPIIGEGVHGNFVDADGNLIAWSYKAGSVYEGKKLWQRNENQYVLKNTYKKIAVLISSQTTSSGEAIAVCFKGLRNTFLFGEKTNGLVTSNDKFILPNGVIIYLTVSRFADRHGKIINTSIEPDIYVPESMDALNNAVGWLKN